MKISRRQLMLGIYSSLGVISLPNYIWAEEKYVEGKTKSGEVIHKLFLHPKKWNKEQKEGRKEAELHFRKKRIPLRLRGRIFEALVFAVKDGKRDHKEIIERANEYLETFYSEVPDWMKWLLIILQIMAALLTILIIFI